MKLTTLFDYFFYRVYIFFRETGDNVPETKGSLILSLVQFLTLLDLVLIGSMIFNYDLPSTKYAFLPLIILIGIINWYRYEKAMDLNQLLSEWSSEDKSQNSQRGIVIVIYLVFTTVFPALYGMMTHGQL